MNKKNTKVIIISVCVLVVLIAAFALIYALGSPNPDRDAQNADTTANTSDTTLNASDTTEETPENLKHITLKVVFEDGSEQIFEASTEGNSLRDALESVEGLVKGDDGQYGLFVTEVAGVVADSAKQQWWCFTRGGETLFTGVDDTAIADGETYEITLTTGY